MSASLGLARAGSRTEGMFWEGRLAQVLDRLLDGAHPSAVGTALDQLSQQDGTAYGALVEAIEHAAETVPVQPSALRGQATDDRPAVPLHALLVTASIVAWTRFSIPTRAIVAPVMPVNAERKSPEPKPCPSCPHHLEYQNNTHCLGTP